jgi:hypothetical protein
MDMAVPLWNYDKQKLEWFTPLTLPYQVSHEAAHPYLPTERAKRLYDLYHQAGLSSVDAYGKVSELCRPGFEKLNELNSMAEEQGRLVAMAEAIAYLDELLAPEIDRLERGE